MVLNISQWFWTITFGFYVFLISTVSGDNDVVKSVPLSMEQIQELADIVCINVLDDQDMELLENCQRKFKESDSSWLNEPSSSVDIKCWSQDLVTFKVAPSEKWQLVILAPERDNTSVINFSLLKAGTVVDRIYTSTIVSDTFWSTVLNDEGVPTTWHKGPIIEPYNETAQMIQYKNYDIQMFRNKSNQNNITMEATFVWNATDNMDLCFTVTNKCKSHKGDISEVLWPDDPHSVTIKNLPLDDTCNLTVSGNHETAFIYQTLKCKDIDGCVPKPEIPRNVSLEIFGDNDYSTIYVKWSRPSVEPEEYNLTLLINNTVTSILIPGNTTEAEFPNISEYGLYNVSVVAVKAGLQAVTSRRGMLLNDDQIIKMLKDGDKDNIKITLEKDVIPTSIRVAQKQDLFNFSIHQNNFFYISEGVNKQVGYLMQSNHNQWTSSLLEKLPMVFRVPYLKDDGTEPFACESVSHMTDFVITFSLIGHPELSITRRNTTIYKPYSANMVSNGGMWAALSLLCITLICVLWKCGKHRKYTNNKKSVDNSSKDSNAGYLDNGSIFFEREASLSVTSEYKFGSFSSGFSSSSGLECRLMLHEVIGEGAFGVVRRATLLPGKTVVAVKMLKDFPTSEEKRSFASEMELLRAVGTHPNVVTLLGAADGPRPMIVQHYCSKGDLLTYLRSFFLMPTKRQRKYSNIECNYRNEPKTDSLSDYTKFVSNKLYDIQNEPELTPVDLLSFCRQIAMGMEFLASNKIVHRDLAARNVLVSEDRTLKIADFGLSRDVYQDNLYKQKGNGKMPIKWMAPESLSHRIFSSQSDVWSFGVVMWEVWSLGAAPYLGVAGVRLPRLHRVGYRMPQPPIASPALYDVMLSCWRPKPRERPTFTELHRQLDSMLNTASPNDYLSLNINDLETDQLHDFHDVRYRYAISIMAKLKRGWSRVDQYERPFRSNYYTPTPVVTNQHLVRSS